MEERKSIDSFFLDLSMGLLFAENTNEIDRVVDLFLEKISGKEYLDLETYRAIMKEIQKETLTKGKPLYMAVRCGITRSTKGPEMDSVATILPVAELTRRIKATMERAGMA